MAAHQAPLSLGFSKQEHWSGLPFPSPMHESEKWKWRCSVVSDSWRPQGLQPTRLLHPWDFPGKSTGVGCHCLLHSASVHTSKIALVTLHCNFSFVQEVLLGKMDLRYIIWFLWMSKGNNWSFHRDGPWEFNLRSWCRNSMLSCFSCVWLCATPQTAAH